MPSEYVELRCRSAFSFLDGASLPEELVTAAAIDVLDTPRLAAAIESERRAAGAQTKVALTLEADEAQLTDLARDWAERRITRAEWLAAREAIERRVEAAQTRLARDGRAAALDGFVGKAGKLTRAWAGLSLDRQRAIISSVIERVA